MPFADTHRPTLRLKLVWEVARASVRQAAGTDNSALTGARTAYQDFLSMWKDADPDIPILNEARAEFAKLK